MGRAPQREIVSRCASLRRRDAALRGALSCPNVYLHGKHRAGRFGAVACHLLLRPRLFSSDSQLFLSAFMCGVLLSCPPSAVDSRFSSFSFPQLLFPSPSSRSSFLPLSARVRVCVCVCGCSGKVLHYYHALLFSPLRSLSSVSFVSIFCHLFSPLDRGCRRYVTQLCHAKPPLTKRRSGSLVRLCLSLFSRSPN